MTKVISSTGSSTIRRVFVAGFAVLAVTLFRDMTGSTVHAASQDSAAIKSTVEERIKPTAEVSIAAARPAAASPDASSSGGSSGAANKVGETTYNSLCMGCHASGALGSPKFGDKAAWAPRIAQGMETLYNNALKGKKNMPAKGGNPGLSDADVKATVDYMVAAAK